MTRTRVSALLFVVASSLAGCTGTGDVEYAGEVRVTSPELVEIGPGVQVIADADEPIFFAQGDYWLYRDGYWFRSRDYRSGYARVEFTYVPTQVRVIERPERYVHYRSNLGRNRAARSPQVQRRSTQPPGQQQQQPMQQQPTQPHPAQQQPGQQPYPSQQQPVPPQPTYPGQPSQPNAPKVPLQGPSSPTDPHGPHHAPGQTKGANPAQPTSPPGPNAPVQTPNDHRREPEPQRDAPTQHAPGHGGTPPGQAKDRGPSAAPAPQGPSAPPATNRPSDRPESGNVQDRADRATPPGQNKTDDRTKKVDEQKDKQDKRDK